MSLEFILIDHLTEIDRTHVNVEWKILPQLTIDGRKEPQKLPSTREASISDPEKIWIPELEKNLKKYTRLEYLIKTEIDWMTK